MNDIYIDLIISTIIENYGSEEAFYEDRLGVSPYRWQNWKKGRGNLSPEEMQKIKNLFSDYEWMLLQKVLRQTIIYPEKRMVAVSEFRRMKTKIARQWLNIGLATVEILDTKEENNYGQYLDMRVTIHYGEWGFDDIINFRLPAYIQQQIDNEQVALLDWVNDKLEETYNS
ncbi:hypothetical protein GCM10025886_27220 [Tetragenococcus halophilus subsp. flandriensis]|uniref:hypothetical protein n=1 Tax=Tetragenococcus halophilus TaxID=51669 RepID=UPI0023E9A8DD|nr:hypothetical protein [Tetragenococcus halophilus]GMA09569.1 hypothetical protein GCM10025886_27220 [Tetragenococcus halophilus subsp. flandriensis]